MIELECSHLERINGQDDEARQYLQTFPNFRFVLVQVVLMHNRLWDIYMHIFAYASCMPSTKSDIVNK